MSTALYWRPAAPPPPGRKLPYELKPLLGQRIWQHDGTLNGDPADLSEADVPYLEGLFDAGSEMVREGARELIAAIAEHGVIEVSIRE